ncbi:Predicted dehydrogenase [Sanguibacter gelidistatuariae]|uniref:Predicted dehydrogenase n=1 Tax=Sanguibacter gelidistatuariae TaxID=1814289 RepID=A0A1G6N6X5_9MICO|nr:Gfo/Idh/MocA family oxidoreductase [Sanguibacter gelidistatuariae]SDC63147.1 Predicted dehydrogenase [Sanguibacter gelidistatuariae]
MTVRFGIVGVGTLAELHARAINLVDGAELVACVGRRPDVAKRFAHAHGCEYVGDLDSLLDRTDCDVIVVTTPSGTHADIGVRAARRGKHVLCEKPLDVSVEKADQLIAACAENDVLLGVIFQSRFGPGARALKNAVDQGRFGRLAQCSAYVPWYRSHDYYTSADWRGTLADDGGALMNQGIHAVDLLLWLAGDVEEVSARVQTRMHDIEVEDNAVAWLTFASGSLGMIQSSTSCYPGESKRVEIKGELGSVTLVDDVPVLWDFAVAAPEDKGIARLRELAVGAQGASDPKAVSLEGHRAQYEDFVAAIRDGRPPAIPGAEGRRSIHLIRSIYASSETGRTVRL